MSDDKTSPAPKKETWLNWLAVTTILFSTCATISTFRGGGHSSKAMMAQVEASDLWAQYQAKSIKQYIYGTQADLLDLRAQELPAGAMADAYRAKAEHDRKDTARYDTDKKEIAEKAHAIEAQRAENQRHGGRFGLAVVFLQMAIMLSALAAILKKKPLWLAGVLSGLVGVCYFADGFFVIF